MSDRTTETPGEALRRLLTPLNDQEANELKLVTRAQIDRAVAEVDEMFAQTRGWCKACTRVSEVRQEVDDLIERYGPPPEAVTLALVNYRTRPAPSMANLDAAVDLAAAVADWLP